MCNVLAQINGERKISGKYVYAYDNKHILDIYNSETQHFALII